MDQYSFPISAKKTKLAKLISLKTREIPEKPGRSLCVSFDTRFPLIKGFTPKYIYWVRFAKAGNYAGNHYHREKAELFYPISGKFKVCLENPNSHSRETIKLDSEKHVVLHIHPGIAHKVVSESDNAILLVNATAPGIEHDEFYFEIA